LPLQAVLVAWVRQLRLWVQCLVEVRPPAFAVQVASSSRGAQRRGDLGGCPGADRGGRLG